jgi:long-chain acyl-CoA synthetase
VVGDGEFDALCTGEGPLLSEGDTPDTDTFAIFFTSGTTGLPKGAMVSHLNLEMNGYNQAIADASRRDDVNLVSSPVYHMGAVFMAVTYMMLGCAQIVLPAFEAGEWLATLARRRATVSLLIPTMINAILNHADCERADTGSLRLVFYGGGPMPPAVLERAIRRFGCAFTQGYGLTETLEATFLTADDHVVGGSEQQQKRLASAGREAVGAEIRIVDDTGRQLGSGEIGEILIRSRSVIAGYWRMPEATREAIRGDWFYTGDVGYLDEERYLFLVDRKKDMVVSGGVNIYTKEIEAVLYRHPAVLEAAVIGLPDETWGEQVTAVVSLKPGSHASAEELITLCRESLASYKKPREVLFLPDLPKNPSGKILKRELRERFAKRGTA